MQGFDDVTLTWRGQDYTVPANRQMALIAKIEDALSGESGEQAISVLFRRQGPPHTRLAAAFGAALRHAGAKVSDAEIYLSIQTDMISKSRGEQTAAIQACIFALLSIISPPAVAHLKGAEPATESPEKKT